MKVVVYIRYAVSADDANEQCKRLPAYRKLLDEHPSTEWTRTHLQTARHLTSSNKTQALTGPGDWSVEFDVEKKT